MEEKHRSSLLFLGLKFLKIGSTAFGGFMALISIVQKELVEKEKMVKETEVLDAISISSVMPGPMAVNVIAYIGYRMKGLKGGLISMLAVILPSFLLILGLSFVYFNYGHILEFKQFFHGVIPAVAAIILSVSVGMTQKNVRDFKQVILMVMGFGLIYFLGGFFTTLMVIVSSGIAGYIIFNPVNKDFRKIDGKNLMKMAAADVQKGLPYLAMGGIIAVVLLAAIMFKPDFISHRILLLNELLLSVSGVSLTLFGGGYVFIPMLQELVVDKLQWVTQQEFIDGIAMGQITPGPIMISATFIGYKVAGFAGALVATIAIFLPPALLTMLGSRFIGYFKGSWLLESIFYGVHPAVIGMIFAAFLIIFQSIPHDLYHYGIFALSFVLTYRFGIDLLIIIPAAGLIGLLIG